MGSFRFSRNRTDGDREDYTGPDKASYPCGNVIGVDKFVRMNAPLNGEVAQLVEATFIELKCRFETYLLH
jgi:hypothetical protein